MGLCSSKDASEKNAPHSKQTTQLKRQEQRLTLQQQQQQQNQQTSPQQLSQPENLNHIAPKHEAIGSGSDVDHSNGSTLSTGDPLSTTTVNGNDRHLQQQQKQQYVQEQQVSTPKINQSKKSNDATVTSTLNGSRSSTNQNPVDIAARLNTLKEVKILLLGSGESGKSTVVKQMKILHQEGFSVEELYEYKPFVYKNIMDCIKNVINAIIELQPELIKPNAKIDDVNGVANGEVGNGHADAAAMTGASNGTTTISNKINNNIENTTAVQPHMHVLDYDALQEVLNYEIVLDGTNDTTFDAEIASKIEAIYNHPEVKEFMIHKQGQFYLIDSTEYFLTNLHRIAQPDYIPSTTDILHTRKKTSGIFDFNFDMGNGLNIHLFDVGGQRSERKKWIHCFDNVTLIIFCVALSEYDQVLLEENNQNRLEESLALFDSVVNSRWFARTSIVLFLNKIDVFAEKLQYSPLEAHFPDYTGGNNINKAAKYILWRFNQVNRSGLNIYPHVTQATDTSNIKLVMAAVKETIMENSLKDSGII